jgi:hypothetical protein
MKRDNYIFTEGFNCGRLLGPCLESFFKYHDHDVHIILSDDDIVEAGDILNHERVHIINVSNDPNFETLWTRGHHGTALAFATVIKIWANGKNVIHFDSDVIFKDNCIDQIISYLDEGYDIVGPPRPYKNNLCNNNDVRQFDDVIMTYAFGINTNKIPDYDFEYFVRMCGGFANPLNHIVLDFFDGVVFAALDNNASIMYLDTNEYGGPDREGSRYNDFKSNLHFDCGSKIIHFGGVGSGYAFDKSGRLDVNNGYKVWALGRWALYSDIVLGEKIDFDDPTVYGRDIGVMDHEGKRWCKGAPDGEIRQVTLRDLESAGITQHH